MTTLEIDNLRSEARGGIAELSAVFRFRAQSRKIFFRTAHSPVASCGDPFVPAAVLPAMRGKFDIDIRCAISEDILLAAGRVQADRAGMAFELGHGETQCRSHDSRSAACLDRRGCGVFLGRSRLVLHPAKASQRDYASNLRLGLRCSFASFRSAAVDYARASKDGRRNRASTHRGGDESARVQRQLLIFLGRPARCRSCGRRPFPRAKFRQNLHSVELRVAVSVSVWVASGPRPDVELKVAGAPPRRRRSEPVRQDRRAEHVGYRRPQSSCLLAVGRGPIQLLPMP